MRRVTQFNIEEHKLTRYLLNLSHRDGGPKAKWFLNRGFSPNDPERLANALAQHAMSFWPGERVVTPDAEKHVVKGLLVAPDGSLWPALTVWQIKADGVAWLVTARPAKAV